MLTLKNILVATDFSECSAAALTYARELAHRFGARLHVLHALEVPQLQFLGTDALSMNIQELRVQMEADARADLDRLITPDDRRDLQAVTVIRDRQTPTEAITQYAAAEQIDLIIVGTHGRRGFSHMVMGSVAEKVVRTAPCPVLTVRQHEREFVVPETNAPITAGA